MFVFLLHANELRDHFVQRVCKGAVVVLILRVRNVHKESAAKPPRLGCG